jgi:hypothetical protein
VEVDERGVHGGVQRGIGRQFFASSTLGALFEGDSFEVGVVRTGLEKDGDGLEE